MEKNYWMHRQQSFDMDQGNFGTDPEKNASGASTAQEIGEMLGQKS